jgi:hypothetical protein
MRSKNRRKT